MPKPPQRHAGICAAAIIALAVLFAVPAAHAGPVKLGGQLQSRLYLQPATDDPDTDDDESQDDPTRSFQLRRVRADFYYKAKRVRFKLKLAMEKLAPRLMDAYIRYKIRRGLRLYVGQMKRRVNYDYIISSSAQRLHERSLPGNEIDSSRDIGARLRARFWDKRIEAEFALLNGNGARTLGNDNGNFRVEGRVDAHVGHRVDAEITRIPRRFGAMFGAGASRARRNDKVKSDTGELLSESKTETIWSAHLVVQGWRNELRFEHTRRAAEPIDARTDPTTSLPEDLFRERDGTFIQWAWLLPWPGDVEWSARYGVYRPFGRASDRVTNATVGFKWLLQDELVQAGIYGWRNVLRRAPGTPLTTYGLVTQLQFKL